MIRNGFYGDNILVNNNLGEGVFCIIDSEQWCDNCLVQTLHDLLLVDTFEDDVAFDGAAYDDNDEDLAMYGNVQAD